MPIYEYHCPKCGDFEQLESIKASEVKQCPKCGEKSERIISPPSKPIFKGRGFYETDYQKKKK